MLRKLLKYEIKATARTFLPLYLVLLAYAIIHAGISLLSSNGWELPQIISMAIYVTIMIGIFVVTLVVIIQRFYKNLLSDEGYLMFTLPAKPWMHIVSKLIVSFMWMAASGIVAIISIIIITFNKFTSIDLAPVIIEITKILGYIGTSGVILAFEIIISIIIGLCTSVLMVYASIAVGHLFNKHKVLASLGAFIVFNMISQIIAAGVSFIPGTIYNPIRPIIEGNIIQPSYHIFVCYTIAFSALLAVGYFALTNYILNKRLNLE